MRDHSLYKPYRQVISRKREFLIRIRIKTVETLFLIVSVLNPTHPIQKKHKNGQNGQNRYSQLK